MKKLIGFLSLLFIFSFVLSACNTEPAPETANYNGTSEEYVYWYEEGRNRDWEEDIIYFADSFLEYHPIISEKECKITVDEIKDDFYYSDELYDENLRAEFIESINILIPKISGLDGSGIAWELSKIVALLKDNHSYISPAEESFYGITFDAFYSENGVDFYAVAAEKSREEIVFSKLKSINGISIEEIIERGKIYIPHENEYDLCASLEYWLSVPSFLKHIGVTNSLDETAEFIFINEDGTDLSAVVSIAEESAEFTKTEIWHKDILMYKNPEDYYWYELIDDKTVYVRINSFYPENYETLAKMTDNLQNSALEKGGVAKTIIDLRDNIGGISFEGYTNFIETISSGKEFGQIYILINDWTASRSVETAVILKQNSDNVTIVGIPAKNSPNFFGIKGYGKDTMPNSGLSFGPGDNYNKLWPDYEHDALMPDITIYQTIEDYKNGIDTVLEAVLAME